MNISEKKSKKKNFNVEYLLISVILLLGTFLRLFHLCVESFWLDETYTATLIQQSANSIITITASDVHPPLFYLLLHFFSMIFGTTEFSMRLPSAIFGIASLFIMWKVGKLLFSKNLALLSTFFLAISPLHIQYSQEARANSLLLLSVLASYYFLFLLQNEKKTKHAILYFIATSLTIWTHNLGIIYIGIQVLWIGLEAIFQKEESFPWKKWGAALGLVAISYAPWISIIIYQIQSVGSGSYWLGFAVWQNFVNSFISFTSSILGFILIIPLIVYVSFIKRKDKNFRIALSWGVFTPLIIWTISTFLIPVFLTRNIIPSLPAFVLLAALGLTVFRYKPLNVALISIFTVSCIINLYSYYTVVQKDQWREVAAYLEQNLTMEDQVYFEESYGKTGLDWYLEDSAYQSIDTPNNDAWLIIYTDKKEKVEELTERRDVIQFKNITLAYPIDYPDN